MRISEVLRGKGPEVVTVKPHLPVRQLLHLLADANIGAAVVSEDGTAIEGIVSERDIVRHLRAGIGVLEAPVAQIMTRQVHTCEPCDTVDALMRLMTEHRVRHVPVLDAGRLAGLVSIGDVVKTRIGELEFECEQLENYIGQA